MSNQTVFIVDDNHGLLKATSDFLSLANLNVETYPSPTAFLENYTPAKMGCLILDLKMPEMSGLELQERLVSSGATIPTIIVTGHANVSCAVQTMKFGAFEFIEKPYSSEFLLKRVLDALEFEQKTREESKKRMEYKALYDAITAREKQILSLVVTGRQSKVIADQLNLSVSTVDNHRANIMKKLNANSTAELIRIALIVDPKLLVV